MKNNHHEKRSRLCLVSVIFGLSLLLSGCGIDLTDEQNRIIAEYAADLLLEYDAEYQAKYGNTDTEDTEGSSTEIPSEVPEEPEMTTEVVSEEPIDLEKPDDIDTEPEDIDFEDTGFEDNSEAPQSTEEDSGNIVDQPGEEDTDIPPSSSDNVTDIAEIVGLSGISITYSKCLFLDRYPSIDQDGAFIYLDADPGYKLAVVKFNIKNLTSDSIMVDMLNTDIDYRIVMNRSKAAKPMLTILMDDLGTYSSSVPGNSEQSAVLVFQISESSIDQIQSLDIKVTYNKKENVIHIQ